MNLTPPLCHCGRPMHYPDPSIQCAVERLIGILGEDIIVTIGPRSWLVPRHYVALHGLKGAELEFLGFPEVRDGRAQ